MQAFRAAPRLTGGLAGALRHSSTGVAGRGLAAASPAYGIAIARRGVWAPGRPLAATAVGVAAVTRRWCSTSPAEELPPKIKDLVDQIASLTLLEAAQLTDGLKERLGISNAMMMPAGGAPAAGGGAAAPVEAEPVVEQTAFSVRLEKYDSASKIKLIKEVRAVTGLGLKEAKEMVEGVPKVVKEGMKKEEAEELKAKLEAAGGATTIV